MQLQSGMQISFSDAAGVIWQTVGVQAQVRVKAQTDNVAGVRIPKFEQLVTGGESKMNLTGLGKGGQQVQATRKARPDPGAPCALLLYAACTLHHDNSCIRSCIVKGGACKGGMLAPKPVCAAASPTAS